MWWLALSPQGNESSWYESRLSLSVWSLHVFPVFAWVLSGYSGLPPPPKNMHVRFVGDSKSSLGVSVSVDGCVSHLALCGPVMDWRPVQLVTCLLPNDSWDRLQSRLVLLGWNLHVLLDGSASSCRQRTCMSGFVVIPK